MELNERLRQIRNEKSWTQGDLATAAGISRETVINYENGRRKPTFDIILKLADALEVTLDYLLGTTDDPKGHAPAQPWTDDNGTPIPAPKLNPIFNYNRNKLLENFDKLNTTGEKKAVESVKLLTKVPEYQKDKP